MGTRSVDAVKPCCALATQMVQRDVRPHLQSGKTTLGVLSNSNNANELQRFRFQHETPYDAAPHLHPAMFVLTAVFLRLAHS